MKDWGSEIVVITGGSHGLGNLLARDLALVRRAKNVVILDVRPPEAQVDGVTFHACDVSDRGAVRMVAARIVREIGHPTVLFNNAGIVTGGKLLVDTDEEDIERTFNINLLGQIWMVKAFLPHMLEANKGHIVTLSSVVGHAGAAYAAAYCASKAGLNGFQECLRQELLPTKIRMTTVYPGLIDTGMFTGCETSHGLPWLTPLLRSRDVSDRILEAVELGRNEDIFMPLYANAAPLFRFLPLEFGDWVRWLTGANNDMRSFKHSKSALSEAGKS